jgi:large repetitive protein
MFARFPTLAAIAALFAAACASNPAPTPDPGDPGDPGDPADPGGRPVSAMEQAATAMGVVIMSSDDSGTPRLIRSILPRASALGMTPQAAARDHVAALAPLWGSSASPMALVEAGTQQLRNGATVVRLAQHVDGVLVDRGELRVLMHPNGSLAAVSGTLLSSSTKPSFVSSPRQALERALDAQYGTSRPQLAIADRGEDGGWHTLEVASTPELEVLSARARRVLAPVNDTLTEVWEVEVEGDARRDPLTDPSIPTFAAHSYLIADASGIVVRDVDLVQSDAFVYRVYAETNGIRRPFDSALASFAPHPTGVPDGSGPGVVPSNLAVIEAFNGPRDPWLANNATTTSGNNAEAFGDLDANSVFSAGDIRPEVRSGRTLNFTYRHDLEPLATPDQSKAGSVNAFFVVNWMHDFFYDSGFTEATGNGQLDNFGRGGIAGDHLIIAAQAGANTGLRNNATMATPADGARPRMRMFLWTAGTNTGLIAPAGPIKSEAFAAGPRNFDQVGELAAATDDTAPGTDACEPITSNVAGKIALITFSGVCGSLATVNNAKAAGAIGVVLSDGAQENPRAFAGSAAANIPGVAIGQSDGEALRAALAAGPVTVQLTSEVAGPERDGDLDNTIVAHEWGHYFHRRLAGCGGAGSTQCGGMSEGWGDFNAIMMMLTEGDNRDGAFAIAPYALADGVTPDTAYFGIRRFPYSRDRTKNDLSFRHIGDENPLPTTTPGLPGGVNAEVHNAGEIWTTMMWEALNVLADQHGVNVARRRMADYMVGGLLLTPTNATFTEGRDGILAAASALDTDDMLLMAAAFAGRGAGSCAASPLNTSTTNAGVIESGTLAGKLSAGGATLVDDGISCDRDGYLDPGESGTLRLRIANNGALAAENVSVTATTATAGIRLGAPIRLEVLPAFSGNELAIPVTVLQTAPRNTVVTINVHIAGEFVCERDGINLTLTLRIGADDIANAATIDRAETRLSPWTPTGNGAAALWGAAFDASNNQSFLGRNASVTSDTQFMSPPLQVSTTQPLVVNLKHAYNFQTTGAALSDGGVIEVSLNGGATWNDVTTLGVNPGYTGAIANGNPLAGRQGFGGVSPGFPARSQLTLNFGAVPAGLSVMLRFRIGTNAAGAASGWDIDDIDVAGITNTPFPVLVPEPSTCTARERSNSETGVLAAFAAPATSMRAHDQAACILAESAQ